MANESAYDFSAVFAQLTCIFEDAAGSASEGQSAKLSAAARQCLVGDLNSFLHDAKVVLKEIRAAIDR
jgi:hypothetical protein